MKKEPLFFTEKTEIGAQHVPIDSNKFAEGGLIAPNGKPSGLYFTEIYNLVRTPEFKNWFGDWEEAYKTKDYEGVSKVIDENGEPLICVHNTPNEFTVFDRNSVGSTTDGGFYGKGFYFTPNVGQQRYGEIELNCFLNIKNPYLKQESHRSYELNTEDLESKGFDGVIVYPSWVEDFDIQLGVDNCQEIVAYYSEQIKLGDGTNTTFDKYNDDIRFKDGGSIDHERIVCENCGWSWKVKDGGDDLYECHKCDHDNTPNSFMKWYIDWYKGISDKMVITMSLPNAIAPFKEKNVVILDVFEKKDQNIDAKPYLKKIVEKADEYGVVIYLEPKPRTDSVIDYYERFGFELTPNKQFMKRIPHFAGGGGIDINEPFNVNGKTLAERVRILLKQLYPDYKWSVTSSYNKLDVYLLEADFDPFTDKWREEYPTRNLYYSVDDRDFEKYTRENKPLITDRAVEVFKPIREYLDKFVYNRNAGEPYADGVDYNVYENTYIGKWDKPYKQVEPKAGKKAKAPSIPKVAPTPIYPEPKFKVGDIVTYRSTQDKKYRVIEFIEFDKEIQENVYRIESLSDKTKGKAKENMMSLVEQKALDNTFSIQNIVSKTQWSDGLKQSMITDFVNSGYEDVTPLIGSDMRETSKNIEKKVDGFASGKNTYLQANYLADMIHILISQGNVPTPSAPTPETDNFLEYLKSNNEKATLIPRELEVMNALTLFVQSAKDIENLDADRYANLTVNMVAKLSENK